LLIRQQTLQTPLAGRSQNGWSFISVELSLRTMPRPFGTKEPVPMNYFLPDSKALGALPAHPNPFKTRAPLPMDCLNRSGKDVQLLGLPLPEEVNWWWTCQNSYNPRSGGRTKWDYTADQLQANKIGQHPLPLARDRVGLAPWLGPGNRATSMLDQRQPDQSAAHPTLIPTSIYGSACQQAYTNHMPAAGSHGVNGGYQQKRAVGVIPRSGRWGISPHTQWRLTQCE